MIFLCLRKMIDSAFQWAAKKSLIRTSEVHGEEEAKIILEEGFSLKEEEGEERSQNMTLTVEEPCLAVIYLDVSNSQTTTIDLAHVLIELYKLFRLPSKDPNGSMFEATNMPSMASSSDDILRHGEPEGGSAGDTAAFNSGSFKCLEKNWYELQFHF